MTAETAEIYHRRKNHYLLISILTQVLFFWIFLSFGLAGPLWRTLGLIPIPDLWRRVVFFSAFYFLWRASVCPTRYLSGYRLEKDFNLLYTGRKILPSASNGHA